MRSTELADAVASGDLTSVLQVLRRRAAPAGVCVDHLERETATRSPAPHDKSPGVRVQPRAKSPAFDMQSMTLHSQDPAELTASVDEGSHRVGSVIAAMRSSWMRDALCAEFDIDLWFPSKGQRNTTAMEICGRCPVREECLAEALDDESLDHGIRGGMTVSARRNVRRLRRRTLSARASRS